MVALIARTSNTTTATNTIPRIFHMCRIRGHLRRSRLQRLAGLRSPHPLEDPVTAVVSPCLAELLEERFRVEDIRLGLLQPATNHLAVDLRGITKHSLRRPVFSHRCKASLVERLSIPKQEVDGLRRRLVTDNGIVTNEPYRASMPYLGGRLGKGR